MPINVKGGKQQPVFAKQTINITDTGLNQTNLAALYSFNPSLLSHVPGRPINGLKQLVVGEGYLITPKIDMDLSEYFSPPFDIQTNIQVVE